MHQFLELTKPKVKPTRIRVFQYSETNYHCHGCHRQFDENTSTSEFNHIFCSEDCESKWAKQILENLDIDDLTAIAERIKLSCDSKISRTFKQYGVYNKKGA